MTHWNTWKGLDAYLESIEFVADLLAVTWRLVVSGRLSLQTLTAERRKQQICRECLRG